MYNGKFDKTISVVVTAKDHEACLEIIKRIRKLCDAWFFCVRYSEYKNARKGIVLTREIMIMQNAYAPDILIFTESLKRCVEFHQTYNPNIKIVEHPAEPENKLRQQI